MSTDVLTLMKRVVELAMPNLRAYYRITRKAKVVATYASKGVYYADVQPLRNDDSVDEKEPVIPRVEIPIMWAGPLRGVVCPPLPGTHCDLTYYDGDPDYPRISNFRWHVSQAPECEVDAFIIQKTPGVHIKIDSESNIIHFTPADRINEIGTNRDEKIGVNNTRLVGSDENITVGGNKTETVDGHRISNVTGDDETFAANWTIEVDGMALVKAEHIKMQAEQITRQGNETTTGVDGEIGQSSEKTHRTHEGSYTCLGKVTCSELVVTGNSHAATRSGGSI